MASQCLNPLNEDIKEGESGQYLLPSYIGKGIGSLMKREFFNYIFDNNILQRITEKVKKTNIRNQQVNLKLGFKEYASDEKYISMN